MDHGTLNGAVIAGCTVKLHSGAFVNCPPGVKPIINTVKVTGQLDTTGRHQGACTFDSSSSLISTTVSSTCSATVQCK